MAGWKIFIDRNENGQFDSSEPNVITDVNGDFQFAVTDTASSLLIAEEQKSCWERTYPGGAGTHTVTVIFEPGEIFEVIDFGNARPTEIHPSAWDQEEQDKLLPADGATTFGHSVSISGDYAIVGAYYDDYYGSAYILAPNDINCAKWDENIKLTASDGGVADFFGYSVSISGDYAIVGAYGDDDKGNSSGSAYIFKREGETWGEQAKLTAAAAGDYFGRSVSISGDYAIVGANGDDDNGSDSGSTYIFTPNDVDPNNWDQVTKLTASDGDAYDSFGYSVSISGDYAIVGACDDEDNGTSSGSAYIFKRYGETWSEQAKLTAADGDAYDSFGCSVSISGDYAIVGSDGDEDKGLRAGAAHIFKREGETWGEKAKLTATDGAAGDYFGRSVSINGSYAVVGADGDDDNGSNSGSAYMFGKVLCPSMDVTGDCLVNFHDIAAVADQWLQGVQ